jgi:hypothetical protein
MRTEAADAGRLTPKLWHDKDYPRIRILILASWGAASLVCLMKVPVAT